MRTYDAHLIEEAIIYLLKYQTIDIPAWIADPNNIVLVNEDGDVAIFEKGIKDIYSGHYYFKSRGKKALVAARNFLDEIFNTCYNIDVLIGLVPLNYLGSRWLTRQLGFKSQGVVHAYDKHFEMFILYKKDFNV